MAFHHGDLFPTFIGEVIRGTEAVVTNLKNCNIICASTLPRERGRSNLSPFNHQKALPAWKLLGDASEGYYKTICKDRPSSYSSYLNRRMSNTFASQSHKLYFEFIPRTWNTPTDKQVFQWRFQAHVQLRRGHLVILESISAYL